MRRKFLLVLIALVLFSEPLNRAGAGFYFQGQAANNIATCTTNGSDGYAGAPSVSAQFPNLLSGYTSRPGWCVAGVGYGVGVSGTLTDWQSISQTGVSVNTGTGEIYISCTGGSVTLSNIDFSLHGGSYIYADASTAANCNLTIQNDNFGAAPGTQSWVVHSQAPTLNLTIKDSTFNGGNGSESAFINYQTTGTVVLEYNYFENGDQHVFEQQSGTITLTYKYNLISNMATVLGAHCNWLQFGTIGTGSTADVEYNTAYDYSGVNTGTNAGEGFQFYPNSSGTLSSPTLANNKMISVLYNGKATIANTIHGGSVTTGTNNNNYFDCSGCESSPLPAGAYYTGTMTGTQGWTSSGNIDMLTGNTITPN